MIPAEKKLLLERLRNQKKNLKWHHPLDDSPYGSGTVREARARINQRIKSLKS